MNSVRLTSYFQSGQLLFSIAIWFGLILVMKFTIATSPPVWDTAMGTFPPAIYLYENSFDVFSLLQLDNWYSGGPNVHSLSLVTWVTAGVMHITGDPTATFVILHLLTFLIAAIGMALTVRLLIGFGLSPVVSWLSALAILLFPVTLVQTGYLYTEIPVMTLTVASAELWRQGRINLAIVMVLLALMVKLTAIAIIMAMLLMLALTFKATPTRNGIRLGLLAALTVVIYKLPTILGKPNLFNAGWGTPELLIAQLVARMHAVPDLAWLVMLSIACSIGLLMYLLCKSGIAQVTHNFTQQSLIVCLLIPLIFSSLIVLNAYRESLLLPRYLVPVIPFSVIALVYSLKVLRLERLLIPLLVLSVVFSLANFNGKYYPFNSTSFSVVERSHAYLDFNQTKVETIEAIDSFSGEIPVYVTRELHYMMSHPMMGYVDNIRKNVFPIFIEPHVGLPLEQFPDQFYLAQASVIHGGRKMTQLVNEAKSRDDYQVTESTFSNDDFSATIYEISRINKLWRMQ